MGFQSTHRAMSNAQFQTAYLKVTEREWREMPIQHLTCLGEEVERRDLAASLCEKIGELRLPHERWARQRVEEARPALNAIKAVGRALNVVLASPEDHEDRAVLTRLANDPRHPMTLDLVDFMMSLTHEQRVTYINGSRESQTTETAQSLPEASTASGETSNGEATALAAALAKPTDQPSTGTSLGAPTTVESGFDVVAYRRLPLVAKRDAFLDNGFLYVRTAVLNSWVRHLTQGKCCQAQRSGGPGHASDCWLRDAVR